MSTTFYRSTDAVTVTPDLVMPWEADDEVRTLVHPILGNPYPDITLREAAASTGTMRLFFLSFNTAETARLFFRAPALFTTTSELGWMPARFVPQDRINRAQQDPLTARWILTVPFQETQ